MSEKFQPPTEFIAGLADLGMDFRKLPQPADIGYSTGEQAIRNHLHQALGYVEETPYPEPVHVSGTPFFKRHLLSLRRLDDPEDAPTPGYAICAAVGLGVEETDESTVFTSMFSVETMPRREDDIRGPWRRTRWTPLTFYDSGNRKLGDPRDVKVAGTILKAAVKKPARHLRKEFTDYLVGGRIWD